MSDNPDYSTYSLAQLRDVQRHIKRLQYPARALEVDAEVARRMSAREVDPTDLAWRSPARNPVLILGVLVVGVAILQFPIFVLADRIGWVEIGNGFGNGLFMVLGVLGGVVLISIGVALQRPPR